MTAGVECFEEAWRAERTCNVIYNLQWMGAGILHGPFPRIAHGLQSQGPPYLQFQDQDDLPSPATA